MLVKAAEGSSISLGLVVEVGGSAEICEVASRGRSRKKGIGESKESIISFVQQDAITSIVICNIQVHNHFNPLDP